jgi:amidase
MRASIEDYLSRTAGAGPHTFQDVYDCVRYDPASGYPGHGMGFLEEARVTPFDEHSAEVWQAYRQGVRDAGPDGVLGVLDDYAADALYLPTDASAVLAAAPYVTLPLGAHPADEEPVRFGSQGAVRHGPNHPFGVAFTGREWSEERLLGMAYALEQATMVRRAVRPVVKPTTELRGYAGALRLSDARQSDMQTCTHARTTADHNAAD